MPYLTYRLTQISQAGIKIADPVYQSAVGLKVRELRVLRLIHTYPDSTSTELLKLIELDKTLWSKNLATLEDKGLILRKTDPADARRQYLRLSKEGEAAWEKAEQIGRKLERELFRKLNDEQWQQLQDLLDLTWFSLKDWQEQQKP
ncbi:MarR family winged helix-turn-helix transcriptional regulator [Neisseria perflava]|uniref:MarR family winged helix-turn-helix transcriptional regulator n=1 Tax=Neisseria perflava TaxID=33053 RepID=UPI0020A08A32|nr:MarR family transcriptional regulator [Neisseria perflava]MCP1660272.1 DNA-binding MarR family transcriptional regulator [Neisseria perflava]MCP1771565.1 DNA-binding MarR family transcriptional regulator [Neisseria perflava]